MPKSTSKWFLVGFSAVPFIFGAVCIEYLAASNSAEAAPALKIKAPSPQEEKAALTGRPLDLGKAQPQVEKLKQESKIIFDDPALSKSWGIAKADAMKAWEVTLGNKDIVVAIIDTGAQVDHEDLAANMWTNSGETGLDNKGRNKANNGIDDDGNGCVDDVHGCDMITHTGDVVDNHGHGTHVAGIIGAVAGNGKGIAGIAPKVSLMILKYFDPKHPNTNTVRNTVEAIRYAVQKGARIINYSGGGLEYSQEEKNAVMEAEKAGILFVAAAGNERSNSDVKKYYPADYGLSNIISVTAIDPRSEVLASSNYGTETVDIAAPGQNILSTLPDNSYGFMTGTSQGTPFVTGAAVLVMSRRPQFTAAEVKKYILATGDTQTSLLAKTRTARQLNLFKAITMLDSSVTANGLMVANPTDDTFGAPSAAATNPRGIAATSLDAISSFSQQLMKKVDRQAGVQGN